MKAFRPNLLVGFNIVTGLASIAGLVVSLVSDKAGWTVSLVCLCAFLLSIVVLLWWGLFQIVKTDNADEYKKISVFSSYETSDGVKGVYEIYRIIQSKRIILTHIYQSFKWSGSNQPKLDSSLQKVDDDIIKGGKNFDKVKLTFNTPLLYNETATVHFKASVDDSDGKAEPYLGYKVDMPVNLIHFRVTLKHKPITFNQVANIEKQMIGTDCPTIYSHVESVSFDKESKSYTYDLKNPEVGYFYRLIWDK